MMTLKKPENCNECSYCDYKYVPEWGECLLTNENLWNVFDGVDSKCPLPEDKPLTKEEALYLLENSNNT